jgi:hypothetical protein
MLIAVSSPSDAWRARDSAIGARWRRVLKCEPTLVMMASNTSKERLEIRSLRRDEVVAFAAKLAPQRGEASGVA